LADGCPAPFIIRIIRIIRNKRSTIMTKRVDTGFEDYGDESEPKEKGIKPVSGSPLEALKALLSAEAASEPITRKVPNREGFSVRLATTVEERELKHWTRSSQRKVGGRVEGDSVKFASLLIAAKCEAILYMGQEIEADGDVVTFRHPAIRTLLGLPAEASHVVVMEHFYGSGGHIVGVANEVLEAAGWGDNSNNLFDAEDEEANPI